jgi:O-antigen ligase
MVYRYGSSRTLPVLMTVAILRWCIFFLAAGATLTISVRDPRAAWAYEFASFVVAAVAVQRVPRIRLTLAIPLTTIASWGFVQLAVHATVDRYATADRYLTVDRYLTMDASLRMAAFAATFIASAAAFSSARFRDMLVAYLAWFGFAIAIVGVLAYYTSPGKLLWIFVSPYPDTWGFFLSRNNFAQFLELALPSALWRARFGTASAIVIAAVILAAGVASASRAGAILLVAETLVCLFLMRRVIPTKAVWRLSAAATIFVAIAGASQLWTRLHAPDPLEYRREFVRSTLAMIAEHPWRGFGLGTFAVVYPAFAKFDAGATVTHAHNDWLEWASEGGVIFAAAWIALAIALLRPGVRSIWGIGVVAILLHALVDFPFARVGTAAWFFVIAGALAVFDDPVREASRDSH